MALTQTQLETMKDALQSALFKGVRRVTFQDRTVDYATTDDMRKALSDLNDELGAVTSSTPTRRSFAAFSRE
jgi:hypothetical protein